MRTTILTRNTILFYCSFYFFIFDVGISSGFNGTCENADSFTIKAYKDWPFRVDCEELIEIWKNDSRWSSSDSYECEIERVGFGIQINRIFEILEGEQVSFIARLVINDTACMQSTVNIIFKPYPSRSCEQFQEKAFKNEEQLFEEGEMQGTLELRCIPPEGSPTIIPVGANLSDFKTRWILHCDEYGLDTAYRSHGQHEDDPNPTYPQKLKLYSIDFYDADNYTCEVSYKDKILHVRTISVCIKKNAQFLKPTLTCTKSESVPLTGSATLKCKGQVVLGRMLPGDIEVEWSRPGGSSLCRNTVYNVTSPGIDDPRHSCTMHGDNSTIECVKQVNENSDVQDGRRIVSIFFHIGNLVKDDYGKYVATLRYKSKIESMDVVLEEDWTPYFQRLVVILTSCLTVLVAIVLVALLIRHFKIYIKIWYKRSWLWKHDKDDKRYVAYLSYYYDNRMHENSLKATQKIVFNVQKQLEAMNYSFYDENREIDFSVQVERITNLVENCHRMVIVLTPEYLDDKWMRFHAELGFHGLMESQMGLVFILMPGVRKLLRKQAKKDKAWARVLMAVKTNRIIKWKETMSDEEFKKHIEYAMPKLLRNSRSVSESSYSENGVPVDYMRSMSQNTECMIIPHSPDSNSYTSYTDGVCKSPVSFDEHSYEQFL